MKILVIFTGGTIGSKTGNNAISLDKAAQYSLISLYEEKYGKENFECICPYQVLSENMDCSYYFTLKESIDEGLTKGYDGIIVTHGSDTIQYTGAFLHYVLGTEIPPVMIVCSNYVLTEDRANGLDNFRYAVSFIKENRGRGVFVPYRNDDGICYIHRGNTLLPHLPYSDSLYEIDNKYYGCYSDAAYTSGTDTYENTECLQLNIKRERDSHVLTITPYPGMTYPKIPADTKAIVHYTYHSGTICADNAGLKEFMAVARKHKIPVYIAGSTGGVTYESCKVYEKAGMINLGVITPAAAYIKIWLQSSASKRV